MVLYSKKGTWDPWKELDALQGQLGQIFTGIGQSLRKFPAINLWSQGDEVLVLAEVPGLTLEDLDLSVNHDVLTLSGNRKPRSLTEGETSIRSERFSGQFYRDVELPFPVDIESAQANLKNGILTVKLTRLEADKPRKIKISSE